MSEFYIEGLYFIKIERPKEESLNSNKQYCKLVEVIQKAFETVYY